MFPARGSLKPGKNSSRFKTIGPSYRGWLFRRVDQTLDNTNRREAKIIRGYLNTTLEANAEDLSNIFLFIARVVWMNLLILN